MGVQMIGTWKMSAEAFENVKEEYQRFPTKALLSAVKYIEDNPNVHTVGQYSYPNEEGFLQLDAAYMNGNNLNVGSVIGAKTIIHPIDVAYDLSFGRNNIVLANDGCDKYALENGFDTTEKLEFVEDEEEAKHDTVGMICLHEGCIETAISSSGRKYKYLGRVGDSPLVGSGFYCDSSIGGAVATGNGEDILRSCLCKEIVDAMMFGKEVQEAVDFVCEKHLKRLLEQYDETFFMVCALDTVGNIGVFTSGDLFPFATLADNEVKLYFAYRKDNHTVFELANDELLNLYHGD